MECCPSRDPLELDHSIELVDHVPRVTTANSTLQASKPRLLSRRLYDFIYIGHTTLTHCANHDRDFNYNFFSSFISADDYL